MNFFQIKQAQAKMLRERDNYAPVAAQTTSPSTLAKTKITAMSHAASENIAAEVKRIVALPISYMPSPEVCDAVSRYYCPKGEYKLWPRQVKAMIEFHETGGLVAPLSVGGGKTLICVLIANDAYSIFGKRKIIHLCPAPLVGQLERMLKMYRNPFCLNVPYHFLSNRDKSSRMAYAMKGQPGVYVMSYNLLSSETGGFLIDAIKPEVMICDEVHKVAKNLSSSRGRRFKESIEKYNVDLIGLSGTITRKRVMDYHLLVTKALKEKSFLPRAGTHAEEWGKIIDSEAASFENMPTQAQPGPITPLIEWCNHNFNTQHKNNLIGFRASYKQRMATCPGVVASNYDDEGEIGATLLIQNTKGCDKKTRPGYEALQKYIDDVVLLNIAPNGDEIEHAFHVWKWRYELESFGCYNNLFWPTAEEIADKRKIGLDQAIDYLEASKKHHEALQEYHRKLRAWIKDNGRQGLDSPHLIGANMARHGSRDVGVRLYEYWKAAKDLLFPEIVERSKSFERVCDFRLQNVLKWADEFKKNKETKDEGAIIWYDHDGVGNWIYQEMKKAGMPVVHCKAGKEYSKFIENEEYKSNFILTTINAHNEGHNCQHFGYMYYAQFTRLANYAEQSLGRSHRNGQKRDEVVAYVNFESDFDWGVFSACLNDAAYVHQTTTSRQKLIYANYSEKPRVVPYAVLCEWGADVKSQTKDMKDLIEKVG